MATDRLHAGVLRAAPFALFVGLASALDVGLPSSDAGAQAKPRGAIYFQVIDTSVNPLGGAEVVLPHLGLAIQVPDEGSLILVDVPNGFYLVQARHLGYRTDWQVVRVTGDTARAHFILMPAAHALDTVSVIADAAPLETRLREFLRRSNASPTGYFITREDLERRRPADFGALLQTVSGVTVQRAVTGPTLVRSRRSADSRCAGGMLVFVDGLLVNSSAAVGGGRARVPREDSLALRRPRAAGTTGGITGPGSGGRAGRRGTGAAAVQVPSLAPIPTFDPASTNTASLFDVNQVMLSTVAGVEVYPTLAGVPPEFRVPGAECGVVLVWTAGS